MLTKGEFPVSFEVPRHTEEFTEEMVIPYRTEELNPYLPYPPPKEINKNPLHSEFIRLREILQINNDIIPLP